MSTPPQTVNILHVAGRTSPSHCVVQLSLLPSHCRHPIVIVVVNNVNVNIVVVVVVVAAVAVHFTVVVVTIVAILVIGIAAVVDAVVVNIAA